MNGVKLVDATNQSHLLSQKLYYVKFRIEFSVSSLLHKQ